MATQTAFRAGFSRLAAQPGRDRAVAAAVARGPDAAGRCHGYCSYADPVWKNTGMQLGTTESNTDCRVHESPSRKRL